MLSGAFWLALMKKTAEAVFFDAIKYITEYAHLRVTICKVAYDVNP